MAIKQYPIEKSVRYFWISIGVFTLAVIFDIISGLGVVNAIARLFDSKPTIILTEPLVKPKKIITKKEDVIIPSTMNDPYKDLQAIVDGKEIPEKYKDIIIDSHHLNVDSNPSIGELLNITVDKYSTYLELFQAGITQHEMYPEDDWVVQKLLHKLATKTIKHAYEKEGGTQFKMIVKYSDGYRAMFKPMRNTRTQQKNINHFYFNDYERHNGEIAAYHLDKILKFRRAVPIVGRSINLTSELFPVADDELFHTFYISPAGKVCFTGRCDTYCDSFHGICGNPHMLEGSFAAYLPRDKRAYRKVWRSPWRRSYDKRRLNPWEVDDNYCQIVRKIPPYDSGRRMLDMMDMAILDFFIGNEDRHHYETFKTFNENDTFIIHLDHGRSFGLPFHDNLPILSPVKQCCMIRKSTLKTLLDFHNGEKKLSAALNDSMKSDPLSPVLWEPHLEALDRRNVIILETIRNCIKKVD
ncbi:hypothetical protein PVAND_011632 [Polypedilum vanderplanki]|uniref:FAM20 C-terminal domain-containing protein n=1 Tax=Polypedilum vanderplanki TaxID=319348 RepID=A0A9J6CJV0_POLVA|nr:hypothetical protein PVAND_011632 [Polypedilum vanderplanki]